MILLTFDDVRGCGPRFQGPVTLPGQELLQTLRQVSEHAVQKMCLGKGVLGLFRVRLAPFCMVFSWFWLVFPRFFEARSPNGLETHH